MLSIRIPFVLSDFRQHERASLPRGRCDWYTHAGQSRSMLWKHCSVQSFSVAAIKSAFSPSKTSVSVSGGSKLWLNKSPASVCWSACAQTLSLWLNGWMAYWPLPNRRPLCHAVKILYSGMCPLQARREWALTEIDFYGTYWSSNMTSTPCRRIFLYMKCEEVNIFTQLTENVLRILSNILERF